MHCKVGECMQERSRALAIRQFTVHEAKWQREYFHNNPRHTNPVAVMPTTPANKTLVILPLRHRS